MTNKSKIIAASAAIAVTAAGIGAAHASTTASNKLNFMDNLVNAIAQRFNLNPSDVQQVIDQQKSKMETQLQQNFTDRINQAVQNGKLTQDQANKIIAEQATIKTQLDALKGKTGTDLKNGIQQIRQSVQQWAKDNNIPPQYVMFGFGGRMGMMGMGKFMGRGHWAHGPPVSPSPTPTP